MESISNTRNRFIDEWNSLNGQERHLKVRWLMNPNEEPLRGAEIVEQSGVIVDVRPLADWHSENVWPVIATPPLINCHTHLEFSTLNEPLSPATPFADWIRSLMQWRREQPMGPSLRAISTGLEESLSSGVAAIGEITTADLKDLEKAFATSSDRMSIVSFREAIGLRPDRISEQLDNARRHLSAPSAANIIRGLSPHAPYTVHPDLLTGLCQLAKQHQAPIAMHLAETRHELELLEKGTGQLADFLKALDLFDSAAFPGGRGIRECLEQISVAPRSIVVHGNYLNDDDVTFLQKHPQCSIAYCPRTHAYFGHSQYPLERYVGAGLSITLGTDSRASNPDLNLWREVRYVAANFPAVPIGTLIAMATDNAATALKLETQRPAMASLAFCYSDSSSPRNAILESGGSLLL